jgi:hypothetical protein
VRWLAVPSEIISREGFLVGLATLAMACGRIGYAEMDLRNEAGGSPDAHVESGGNSDGQAPDAPDASAEPDASDSGNGPVTDGAAEIGCTDDVCAGCVDSADCRCASYAGHLYRFCTNPLARGGAESGCLAEGMHLARIDDALENAWIRSTGDVLGMAEIWTGGEDPTHTLSWQWPDGAQFWTGAASGSAVGGLYNNWFSNSPSGNAQKDCVCIVSGLNSGTWFDRSCTSVMAFVCELY